MVRRIPVNQRRKDLSLVGDRSTVSSIFWWESGGVLSVACFAEIGESREFVV